MKSALFVGRFQPFHNGHLSVVVMMLERFERAIIVVGSAECEISEENPWTAGERVEMIWQSLRAADVDLARVLIIPVRDIFDSERWVDHVNQYVPQYEAVYTGSDLVKECYAASSEGDLLRQPPHSLGAVLPDTASAVDRRFLASHPSDDAVTHKPVEIVDLERVLPISGTMVREMLRKGESVRDLVNYNLKLES